MFDYVTEKWILSSVNYDEPDWADSEQIHSRFKNQGKWSKNYAQEH